VADFTGNETPEQWEGPPGHMRPVQASKEHGSKKRLIIIVVAIVATLVLAVGAYILLLGGKKNAKETGQPSPSTQQQKPESSTPPAQTGPQTYKSAKLNLECIYPEGWTVKEDSDKMIITLTSPQTTYQKKDGGSTTGVFTLKLRNGLVPDAMKPTIQNAVAMRDSEIIAYTNPTDQQRQYTNISFGGTAANTTFFIVSGSVAFKAGEAFGSNIDLEGAVYLFAGGYGKDANDTLAFDPVPKASFEGSMYQQALGIVKTLKIY
jgi:hypothetical protein